MTGQYLSKTSLDKELTEDVKAKTMCQHQTSKYLDYST